MTRFEALIAVAAASLMLAAGLAWQFGGYGLAASGVIGLIAVTFVNPIDVPRKPPTKKE